MTVTLIHSFLFEKLQWETLTMSNLPKNSRFTVLISTNSVK